MNDARNIAAASSVIFLVAFHLVRLGYFLGLLKSILIPSKIAPYLGFLADSSKEVFHLIPEKKKLKFIAFVREILGNSYVTVKTLQSLARTCVSFSRAVLAAKLITREMNAAISQGLRSQKAILMHGALREKISHWLLLESWDEPLSWHDERHVQISVATNGCLSHGLGSFHHLTLRSDKKFLTIGLERNYPGILQRRKPWQSITLCCHAEIKCATCGWTH